MAEQRLRQDSASQRKESRERETEISEEDGGFGVQREIVETHLINNTIQASWEGAGRQPD